jgi:tyrosine-protein kinase Etk/Wzc
VPAPLEYQTETQRYENVPTAPISVREESEISFVEIFRTLWRRRRTFRLPLACAALVSIAVVFLIPPKFTAEAVILTPHQAESSLSAMAQLSGGGASAGLSTLSLLAGFGMRNPSDLYVGMLESRTIADTLINRFNLKEVYGDKYYKTARKDLKWNTTIKAGKDTLIHVEVSDRNPNRAAQLANAYIEELAKRNSSVTLAEATQRRRFFEEQLAKEKDLLAASEIAMRDTQQFTGLMVPGGQAEAMIRSTSQLHAQILGLQAQLAGMKAYASDDNPRVQMIKRELTTLQSDMASLERGEHVAGTPDVPIGNLPQAGLEYLRKYRDVKYHETLYEALAKQYEAARLDEAKAAPSVQIIDAAITPEKRSWPPRTIIVVLTVLLTAAIVALCVLARESPAAAGKSGSLDRI